MSSVGGSTEKTASSRRFCTSERGRPFLPELEPLPGAFDLLHPGERREPLQRLVVPRPPNPRQLHLRLPPDAADLELTLLAVHLGIDPPDELIALQDRQHVVAVDPLRLGRERFE